MCELDSHFLESTICQHSLHVICPSLLHADFYFCNMLRDVVKIELLKLVLLPFEEVMKFIDWIKG